MFSSEEELCDLLVVGRRPTLAPLGAAGARHRVAQSEAFRRALEKAERSELNVLIDPARRRFG
jgi:hypothetical protein